MANQTANQTMESGDTRNVLESKFNNVMTLCAMVPLLIFTCLNSFIHQRFVPCCTVKAGLAFRYLSIGWTRLGDFLSFIHRKVVAAESSNLCCCSQVQLQSNFKNESSGRKKLQINKKNLSIYILKDICLLASRSAFNLKCLGTMRTRTINKAKGTERGIFTSIWTDVGQLMCEPSARLQQCSQTTEKLPCSLSSQLTISCQRPPSTSS